MLLKALKEQGMKEQSIFWLIHRHLSLFEDARSRSYKARESDKYTTIGIGVDLSNAKTKSLFYALDPKRDWDFENMRIHVGYPKDKPLTKDEINKLLWLALVGAGKYKGQTQALIRQLKDQSLIQFEAYQLIALQSSCYNAHTLIGDGMVDALRQMSMHGDLLPILELMEESNSNLEDGLQNRRLKDSALFHGKDDHSNLDVHLTFRQYIKLKKTHNLIPIIPKELIYGLPICDDQDGFVGKKNIQTIPGRDEYNHTNVEIYGTPNNDKLSASCNNHVIYGGNGDDVIEMTNTPCNGRAPEVITPYYAGNEGYDTYSLHPSTVYRSLVPVIMIYDSDHLGRIIVDDAILEGAFSLVSDAWQARDKEMLINSTHQVSSLFWHHNKYSAHMKIENDMLAIYLGEWNRYFVKLVISNYIPGLFNLILVHYKKEPWWGSGNYARFATALFGNKRIAAILYNNGNLLSIYDNNAKMIHQSKLPFDRIEMLPTKDGKINIYSSTVLNNKYYLWWSNIYDNSGTFIKRTLSLNCTSTHDHYGCTYGCIMSTPYPIQDNDQYKLAVKDCRSNNCICTVYDSLLTWTSQTHQPMGMTFKINFKHGNTFTATLMERHVVYSFKNRNGQNIGAPFEYSSYPIGVLYPMVSYEDGTAMVRLDAFNFAYIEAQGIQPPFPKPMEEKKADDKQQQSKNIKPSAKKKQQNSQEIKINIVEYEKKPAKQSVVQPKQKNILPPMPKKVPLNKIVEQPKKIEMQPQTSSASQRSGFAFGLFDTAINYVKANAYFSGKMPINPTLPKHVITAESSHSYAFVQAERSAPAALGLAIMFWQIVKWARGDAQQQEQEEKITKRNKRRLEWRLYNNNPYVKEYLSLAGEGKNCIFNEKEETKKDHQSTMVTLEQRNKEAFIIFLTLHHIVQRGGVEQALRRVRDDVLRSVLLRWAEVASQVVRQLSHGIEYTKIAKQNAIKEVPQTILSKKQPNSICKNIYYANRPLLFYPSVCETSGNNFSLNTIENHTNKTLKI